jgi:hypothetical protein
MNFDTDPQLDVLDNLSDETAAQLLELLYALASLVESRYASQIRRHYQSCRDDQPQLPLADDDPPF